MNNIGTLHLWDKNFGSDQARECELLIKVCANRLSYAILGEQSSTLKVLFDTVLSHPLSETWDGIKQHYNYINYSYAKVKIAVETFNFIFLPSDIYSTDLEPVYQHFVRSSIGGQSINNSIGNGQINTIGSVDSNYIGPIAEMFEHKALYTQAEPLIEGGMEYPKNRQTLLLQFNTGTFEALLLSGRDILFYNIFAAPTADDFNYFLLLIIQQMGIKPTETSVLVAGEIEKYSENYRRVLKYFGSISFADSSRYCTYSDTFKLVQPHQFFSLLSLTLCE